MLLKYMYLMISIIINKLMLSQKKNAHISNVIWAFCK